MNNMNDTNDTNYTTPSGICREEFRAMGTTISLLLPECQSAQGLHIVQTLFANWEQTLSRFLPESELSRLNAEPGKAVVVSHLLFTVLTTALDAAQATQGLYDPAMLDQLVRIGYDRTFDEVPLLSYTPLYPGEPGGGWRGIRVNPQHQTVTLPEGVKLDFGGIAKGMAVDASIKTLSQNGISFALVNAGGDLAVLGLPPDADHWPIAVPGKEQSWTIPLVYGAIATSGIARRFWWQGNKLQHHLLDPRTGQSAQSDLWSVTVVTDRCEQAEVAAKVAFILGSKQGHKFLQKHTIGGLLIHQDGSWETAGPWPAHIMKEENK